MTSTTPNDANPWVKKILETIADSSPIRDGLHDDEAMPLIEWGAACAELVGRRLAAPGAPEPAPDQVETAGYTLVRLMTRINWLATFRTKKDADWLTRMLRLINQLNTELYGEGAPALSEEEIAAWIADQPKRTNGELVQGLIARLTPAGMAAPPNAPSLSSVASLAQGPVLPGRQAPPASSGTPPVSDTPVPPPGEKKHD